MPPWCGDVGPAVASGSLILVLGGARSGKSTFAERLAAELAASRAGRVTFLATCEANDDEMAARVAAHRAARPAAWQTVECPLTVAAAVREHAAATDLFLLDCVTFWSSNLLFSGGAFGGTEPGLGHDRSLLPVDEERAAHARVQAAVDDLLEALDETGAAMVAVSNEAGLGVVPEYPLARLYRDALGWANQRLAAGAERVYFLVAGLPIDVKALSFSQFPSKE